MLIPKIIKAVKTHRLFSEGERILVCVSGGPDSMALLTILHSLSDKMKISLIVAHFNHMLRGRESDGDERFVKEHANSLGLPFVSAKGDVAAYREKHGGTKQEAARILRYGFFQREAKRRSADKIALAHHADDQAETVLMRLLRGSGSRGLSGILPIREGFYARPLLFVKKEEILAFLKDQGVNFRMDRSNKKKESLRNRIRLELVPYLTERYNPRVSDSLSRTADLLRDEDDFLSILTDKLYPTLARESSSGKVVLKRHILAGQHPAIQKRIIRKGVEEVKSDLKGFSHRHLEEARDLLKQGKVGKVLNWPGGITILFSYNTVTITREGGKKRARPRPVSLSVPGSARFMGKRITAEFAIANEWKKKAGNKKDAAWLDKGKVVLPLTVRVRRPGDRFQPLGSAGGKKLKDFLIDRKVPSEERDSIPLLVSDGEIVWVGGVEISDRAKIVPQTREAVKVVITPQN